MVVQVWVSDSGLCYCQASASPWQRRTEVDGCLDVFCPAQLWNRYNLQFISDNEILFYPVKAGFKGSDIFSCADYKFDSDGDENHKVLLLYVQTCADL